MVFEHVSKCNLIMWGTYDYVILLFGNGRDYKWFYNMLGSDEGDRERGRDVCS